MRTLSIYFLAFLTFWMSTWMVTDIHDWSVADADQPHPVFSMEQTHISTDNDNHLADSEDHDHDSHCGVCSYDHGGHMGQMWVAVSFVAESIPVQNALTFSLHSDFWYSRNTIPKLRPPIA